MIKKLTIFILLSIWATLSFAATQQTSSTAASAIIDRAESILNDDDNRTWTAGELLVFLNDATLDIATRTHCLETTENINLSANVLEYSIVGNYITVKSVHYIDEKVTNGTMEVDGNWTAVAGASPHAQDLVTFNGGVASWKFTVNAAGEGTKSDTFTTTDDLVYYYRAYVYPDDTTTVNIYIVAGDASTELVDRDVTGLTQDAWNLVTGSVTETAAGSGAYIAFRSVAIGGGTDTWYIDDVSIYSQRKALVKSSPEIVGRAEHEVEPLFWYDWSSKIGVYPTLGTVSAEKITIYLITRPTAIASSATVTTPHIFDTAIVYYIVAMAYLEDLKPNKHLQLMSMYDAELQRIRGDIIEYPKTKIE